MISGMVSSAEPQKNFHAQAAHTLSDGWYLWASDGTNYVDNVQAQAQGMEQTKMNLKNEFTDASIQVAINQISKAAVQGLKQLIEMAPRLKKADKKALTNLLDTDVGRAVCLVFLGTILPQIPQFQNARAARLFTSIRTQGMALAGNDLIDTVAIPMLKKYTQKDELGLEHMALLNDPGAALAYLESQSKLGGAVAPLMKVLKQFNLVEKEAEVVENKNGMVTA